MTTDPVLLRLEEVEKTLRIWKKMTAAAMCIGVLAGGAAVMAVRPAGVLRVGDRDGSFALLRADSLLFVDRICFQDHGQGVLRKASWASTARNGPPCPTKNRLLPSSIRGVICDSAAWQSS